MDNRVVVPGYKVWLDPRDGRRPAVHVLFLDLEEAPGHAVDGVLLPVAPEELPALDLRERNYVRDDVAAGLRPAPAGGAPVLAYVGSPAGRARCRDGLARGDAVVARRYPRRRHRGVRGGDPAAAGAGARPPAARRAAASATSEPISGGRRPPRGATARRARSGGRASRSPRAARRGRPARHRAVAERSTPWWWWDLVPWTLARDPRGQRAAAQSDVVVGAVERARSAEVLVAVGRGGAGAACRRARRSGPASRGRCRGTGRSRSSARRSARTRRSRSAAVGDRLADGAAAP